MRASFVVATLALPIGAPAAAQFSTAPMPSWYDHGVMRQQTINGMNLRQRRDRPPAAPRAAPRAPRAAPVPSRTPAGTTVFRPTGRHILPARLAGRTPAHRAEAEAWFVKLLDTHADLVRRKRAPANDVARAASFVISGMYYVHRDGAALTDAQLEGLRRQMADIFAHDASFQRLDARARQELYESYVIQGMAIPATFDGARQAGLRDKAAQMQRAARVSLQVLLGVPAARLRFGDEGVSFS